MISDLCHGEASGGEGCYTQSRVVQFSARMLNGHVVIVEEHERNMLIKFEN